MRPLGSFKLILKEPEPWPASGKVHSIRHARRLPAIPAATWQKTVSPTPPAEYALSGYCLTKVKMGRPPPHHKH